MEERSTREALEQAIAKLRQDNLDFQCKLQALRIDESHPAYERIAAILKRSRNKDFPPPP